MLSIPFFQKEVCYSLSNVAAGTPEQLQAVLDADIISIVSNLLLSKDTDEKVKIEATWVLSNATNGTLAQMEMLVSNGAEAALRAAIDLEGANEPATEGLKKLKNFVQKKEGHEN
jgi:hypothetical protein